MTTFGKASTKRIEHPTSNPSRTRIPKPMIQLDGSKGNKEFASVNNKKSNEEINPFQQIKPMKEFGESIFDEVKMARNPLKPNIKSSKADRDLQHDASILFHEKYNENVKPNKQLKSSIKSGASTAKSVAFNIEETPSKSVNPMQHQQTPKRLESAKRVLRVSKSNVANQQSISTPVPSSTPKRVNKVAVQLGMILLEQKKTDTPIKFSLDL